MNYDVVIVGSGAAGLMCAGVAGRRGRNVLLLDHASSIGNKIRISGGGRCNFTNIHASPVNYISQNPRFCISALKRYPPEAFIKQIEGYGIAYHEKTLGQLFCDGSAEQIVDMLLSECEKSNVNIVLNTEIEGVEKIENGFLLSLKEEQKILCESLVIATGGLSIPKIGATSFGYELARQFGLEIIPPRPALVPFTISGKILEDMQSLSGISLEVEVNCGEASFQNGMLFTHRGLSGPAILQISSYWKEGEAITINFAPNMDIFKELTSLRTSTPKQDIQNALSTFLPKRLAQYICETNCYSGRLADLSNAYLEKVANSIKSWEILPQGTEGYRTAEVTLGGVSTDEISSKTFETKQVAGLYFIGEVLDVTGHLGGFNLQWAWSSGSAAGQFV